MKQKRVLIGIIVLYSLLQSLISTLLYDRYIQENISRAAILQTQSVNTYQSILDTFRPIPTTLFANHLNYEELSAQVAMANISEGEIKEKLRKRLFATLRPTYETFLKPKGFAQLQLHLQSGERFLQLFDPLVYGDNTLPLWALNKLDNPLAYAEGFQASTNEYHYYFPLFYNNGRVGIVEISLPFEHFSKLAKTTLSATKIIALPATTTPAILETNFPQTIEKSNEIITHLKEGSGGGFTLKDGQILTAFSLLDASGSPSGILFTLVNDSVSHMLHRHFIQDTLISALILVLALILGLIYYRYVHFATLYKTHDSTIQAHTDALEKHNAFLRSLFQTIPSPAFLKDKDGRFIKCNQAFANLFEKPVKEIVGLSAEDIMDADLAKEVREADAYVFNIQNPFAYEQRLRFGSNFKDFVIHKNILKSDGEVMGIVGIMQDITQRKEYQSRLEKALIEIKEQQAKLAQDNEIINQYAIFVKFNTKGLITDASHAICQLSGFSKEELLGKRWTSFCIESPRTIKALHQTILSEEKWEGVLQFKRKDGNTYWLRSTLLVQSKNQDKPNEYIVFSTDVSNEIHIQGMSFIDELTQIYNRKKFTQSLESALNIIKRYPKEESALILFDIDDFKAVNDTHGHLVGDLVLQELSALVQKHLREIDTFARWGGEEFAIIAPKTTMQGAIKITEKLRKLISEHTFKEVNKLTCSFGITEIKSTDKMETLVGRADEALYSSKAKGKNRIEFLA